MAAETMSPPPAPPLEAAKTASLYVGDLDPGVTESELLQAFSVYGAVSSLRVCVDSQSGKPLGYAYVNFTDHDHASRAMAGLNHTKMKGKHIRIMWSERNPLPRKTGLGNLYVKNLHPDVNSNRLHTLFSEFGTVLSCKVAEVNGTSKGFGYVQFDCQESAMAAVNALHDKVFEGKKLYVSQFIKKSERTTPCSDHKFTSLYVKNLTKDMTDSLLRDKFSEYGEITSATIMKDPEGKSRGFGFVNFKSPEEAMAAKEALNGTQLGSKILFVGRAQNKAEREELLKFQFREKFNSDKMKSKDSNLYVKNLDPSIDDNKLQEYFSTCGQITSSKVMRHDDGNSKGFGFVCFSTPEEAQNALLRLNGTVLQGQQLYVAKAQRKDDRCKEFQKSLPLYPSKPSSLPPHRFWPFNINAPLFFPSYPPPQPNVYPSGTFNMSARYPLPAKHYQQLYSNAKNRVLGLNYGNSGAGSGSVDRPHPAARGSGKSKITSTHNVLYPHVKQHQGGGLQAAKPAQVLKESNTDGGDAFSKFSHCSKY